MKKRAPALPAPRGRLWLASGAATLAMGIAMLVSRVAFAAPVPPEMLFNYTGRLLGVPWMFNLIHSLPYGLDAYAKYVLFAVSILLFLAFWFLVGGLYRVLERRVGAWGAGAFYVALSVLGTGLVLLPIQGLGVFGLAEYNFLYPPLLTGLWSGFFGLVFAVTLGLAVREPVATVPERRESLKSLLGGLVLVGAVATFGRGVLGAVARAQGAVERLVDRLLEAIAPEITPVPEHYVVSKNVISPRVPADRWSLRITGLVDNELTLGLEELMALEAVERPCALTCISNPVGGELIGNSVWTGVRMRDLLASAGIQGDATEVILRAADNYSDSFPLEAAVADGTIVAYLQNGEPLTVDHGFPARVLVPGIYGMKNVKWVNVIELASQDHQGYWQTRGWSDSAIVQTMSRIDSAEAVRLEDGSVMVGGVAFAGLRGIQAVQVSVDGGATWRDAQVQNALNEFSWNLWGFGWRADPGTYEVLVRAVDGTGEVQTGERERPLPDGATGYHRVRVTVA